MRHLPETAWLRANRNFGDHIEGGDAGLYDLLLNPRDRAYTVSDFAALLHARGPARSPAWMEPMRYDPAAFLPDPKLRAAHRRRSIRSRAPPWPKRCAAT